MSRSDFCRTQEALHQKRSESETLPNTRKIAMAAATAWGREAELALVVERRRGQAEGDPSDLDADDLAIVEEFRSEASGLDMQSNAS
jgi:hypothetical protein